MGTDPGGQLYDLEKDLAETRNLLPDDKARAQQLRETLNRTRKAGRMPVPD
jgi:hypothetical protein